MCAALVDLARAGELRFPNQFQPMANDLIKRLLTDNPAKRLGCLAQGAEDIKKHKWFRGLNWGDKMAAPLSPQP